MIKNGWGINPYNPWNCFSRECYRCNTLQGRNIKTKIKTFADWLTSPKCCRENPVYIYNKKKPARFNMYLQPVHSDSIQNFHILLHMWNILWWILLDKGEYRKFWGFIVKLHSEQKAATFLTHLPPAQTPITKNNIYLKCLRNHLILPEWQI